MRTTLDIDEDVLAAARDLAKLEDKTMGEVISDLARRGLTAPSYPGFAPGFAEAQAPFDVGTWPTFPGRAGVVVSNDTIDRIQCIPTTCTNDDTLAGRKSIRFYHQRYILQVGSVAIPNKPRRAVRIPKHMMIGRRNIGLMQQPLAKNFESF